MAKKNGRKPLSLRKAEFLAHWRSMKRKRQIKPVMVPYGHTGSTFAADGIRITGSRQFIDQVLSHLTALLAFEGPETRLGTTYSQSSDRKTGLPIPDAWQCYLKVYERGDQAKMANAMVAAITGGRVTTING